MSFPFKIELPKNLRQDIDVNFIQHVDEYKGVFDKILNNHEFYESIAAKGKIYFDSYCTPRAQAKHIVELILNS